MGGDADGDNLQAERYTKTNTVKAQQFAEYRRTKNSFWPKTQEFTNPWTLAVIGAGIAGLVLERGVRSIALRQ